MSWWWKIESAPMDGTTILLACKDKVDAGHYWKSESIKNPRGRWVWNGWPKYTPTHWHPLPKAPK